MVATKRHKKAQSRIFKTVNATPPDDQALLPWLICVNPRSSVVDLLSPATAFVIRLRRKSVLELARESVRNSMTDKTRAPWLSIVLAGLLAFVLSMAITAATVAGYAMALAIKAQGPPDPDKIAAFANRFIPFLGPAVLSLLVLIAARWVMRRAKSTRVLYGVLVGVVAAVPTLVFIRRPDLSDVIGLVLPPLAGWLGALWARKSLQKPPSGEAI
jgi:hypothetical protein